MVLGIRDSKEGIGVHRKVRNQRKNVNHIISRRLVKTFDYIVFEDLQINNMVQNHHFAKSILDAGWGQIIRFTAYKAEYAGKTVELVDPYGTSQTCLCGHQVPKIQKELMEAGSSSLK